MGSVNDVGVQVAIAFLGNPGRLLEGMRTKLRHRRRNKIMVHSKKSQEIENEIVWSPLLIISKKMNINQGHFNTRKHQVEMKNPDARLDTSYISHSPTTYACKW